jgi:hypothetical protein
MHVQVQSQDEEQARERYIAKEIKTKQKTELFYINKNKSNNSSNNSNSNSNSKNDNTTSVKKTTTTRTRITTTKITTKAITITKISFYHECDIFPCIPAGAFHQRNLVWTVLLVYLYFVLNICT